MQLELHRELADLPLEGRDLLLGLGARLLSRHVVRQLARAVLADPVIQQRVIDANLRGQALDIAVQKCAISTGVDTSRRVNLSNLPLVRMIDSRWKACNRCVIPRGSDQ